MEQPYRHLLRIAYGSTMELIFTFHQRNRKYTGSIRRRSVNDPITTLPFSLGVFLKYYDGSVALLFRLVSYSAIQKFLFFFKIV